MKSKSKKREEQRRKRRLFLAVIMILFVGIVLTTSTYAWFTANRTVTVQSIDVTVTTSEGLQISTDAADWKSIIINSDITGADWTGVTNQLPTGTNLLNPVSTVGAIDGNGFMKMFKGAVKENPSTGANILTATQSVETNGTSGDFVAFDLFFQSSIEQQVYLTSSSRVTYTEGNDSTGIENAARVAFIREGDVAYGATPASAQTLKLTSGNATFIWEPNYDAHTAAAISSASSIYDKTFYENASQNSQDSILGVKAEIPQNLNIPLNSTNTTYFGSVNPSPTGSKAEGIPSTSYLPVFRVAAGITKVRVYMWIEGQDVDCEDHASGGTISYNLQFSIDSRSTTTGG